MVVKCLKINIPVCVSGQNVEGIVDTASEVTIISDKLFDALPIKPKLTNEITLNTAGSWKKFSVVLGLPFIPNIANNNICNRCIELRVLEKRLYIISNTFTFYELKGIQIKINVWLCLRDQKYISVS